MEYLNRRVKEDKEAEKLKSPTQILFESVVDCKEETAARDLSGERSERIALPKRRNEIRKSSLTLEEKKRTFIRPAGSRGTGGKGNRRGENLGVGRLGRVVRSINIGVAAILNREKNSPHKGERRWHGRARLSLINTEEECEA